MNEEKKQQQQLFSNKEQTKKSNEKKICISINPNNYDTYTIQYTINNSRTF